ncbi:FecR family protein [Pseudoflavitalea rhizosphaerae]|uniref:FecR family protein n=1 Tax=Pseudoflavitalea rhizosphaerae TaxID=1884793 RepID=UPI000F8CB02C|nr:FecR domain-containing protein [Pseudoflavitalea rhizosphaerae]
MPIDKTIIEKFLNNRCDADEAKQVHQYLTEHPEILNEWFYPDWMQASEEGPVNNYFAEDMYRNIEDNIPAQKPAVIKLMPWAAAVIILAFSIWFYLPEKKNTESIRQVAKVEKTTTGNTPQEPWQQHQNNSGNKQKLQLPDGSTVLLAPSASLKFKPAFDSAKRDLFLEGEALFEVAKDRSRPFTVYTGNLSTTALGTSFRITTKAAAVRVQLLTGKVVVRATKKSLPGWKNDVYLLPGQQMNYDAASSLVNISGKEETRKTEISINPPVIAPAEKMEFDNTPLEQVLDQLAKHHEVSIRHKATDLNGIGFTGTIFYKDSLPVILQAIAQMNDLILTTVPGGFSIEKAPNQ